MDAIAPTRIHGEGTAESEWKRYFERTVLRTIGADALVPPGHRMVVVAPHPDDEVLGTGGMLAELMRRGRRCLLVAVTDGSASHPGSTRWTPAELARKRSRESAAGLLRFGVPRTCVIRAQLPDGAVGAHEHALCRLLHRVIDRRDVVFATRRHDGHPDHEAVGRAAAKACATRRVPLLEVPIWMWHWADPADVRVPWQRLLRVPLDRNGTKSKRAAIKAHVSQLLPDETSRAPPVLPDGTLRRLLRPWEAVLR